MVEMGGLGENENAQSQVFSFPMAAHGQEDSSQTVYRSKPTNHAIDSAQAVSFQDDFIQTECESDSVQTVKHPRILVFGAHGHDDSAQAAVYWSNPCMHAVDSAQAISHVLAAHSQYDYNQTAVVNDSAQIFYVTCLS